jgi:hypothetical protein
VEANSPAATTNPLAGDVLVRIDRRIVRSLLDVYRALFFFDLDETMEPEVMYDAAPQKLKVILGRRESEKTWAPFARSLLLSEPFVAPLASGSRPRELAGLDRGIPRAAGAHTGDLWKSCKRHLPLPVGTFFSDREDRARPRHP